MSRLTNFQGNWIKNRWMIGNPISRPNSTFQWLKSQAETWNGDRQTFVALYSPTRCVLPNNINSGALYLYCSSLLVVVGSKEDGESGQNASVADVGAFGTGFVLGKRKVDAPLLQSEGSCIIFRESRKWDKSPDTSISFLNSQYSKLVPKNTKHFMLSYLCYKSDTPLLVQRFQGSVWSVQDCIYPPGIVSTRSTYI